MVMDQYSCELIVGIKNSRSPWAYEMTPEGEEAVELYSLSRCKT
jgi:hypothetical protein